MSISIAKLDEREWVISLGERFDFGSVSEFRRCYESVPVGICKLVTIDFSGTRYMDSSALGMLINSKKHINSDSCKIRLTNCNDQIRKIFSISRFDKKFDIE